MNTRRSVAFSAYAKINFKILVVGDEGVGKTSLILRYVKGSFSKASTKRQGIEFYSNTVPIGTDEVALQIWDTAGSQHFQSVARSFYKQANCVVIAYSQASAAKLTVGNYLLQVNEYAHPATQVFLVRTKIDESPIEEEERDLLDQLVNREANLGMWGAVSTKTGEHVEEFFASIAEGLFHRYGTDEEFRELVDPKKDSFLLSSEEMKTQRRRRCCS